MPNTPTRARDILDALAARYAGMHSYQDQGLVRFYSAGNSTDLPFRTFYAAPNLFRFEFTASHPYRPLSHMKTHHTIGSNGKTAYSWHQHHDKPPKLATPEDLSLAIASATGISRGAAHTVSRLLLPEIGGFSIQELKSPGLLDDLDLSGTPCHQLVGHHPNGDKHILTIERDTLLLRQLRCESPDCPAGELRHRIQVNHPIPAAAFTPPLPAQHCCAVRRTRRR